MTMKLENEPEVQNNCHDKDLEWLGMTTILLTIVFSVVCVFIGGWSAVMCFAALAFFCWVATWLDSPREGE